MFAKRYIAPAVTSDLDRKFVLLSGPRQVGKTTLARTLPFHSDYLNYDDNSQRLMIRRKEWPRDRDLVIFDELHKMKDWKRFLKGLYDVEGVRPRILVTGSARLDIARKMGDSLAGRFLGWRLHPFCPKELASLHNATSRDLNKLLTLSGFPEPYLSGSEEYYKRWAASHLDVIVRQDLIQLERVTDLAAMETLVELLSERVGSTVSSQSLARDLEKDPGTIKRWLNILENLFVIFKVSPWSRNIAKSLSKASKYYFFDTARVKNGIGARFENLVAGALLKELQRAQDQAGRAGVLYFLRSRDGHELDFLVAIERKPRFVIEAKWSEQQFSPHFGWFSKYFAKDEVQAVQLVAEAAHERESAAGVKLAGAWTWLANIDFSRDK